MSTDKKTYRRSPAGYAQRIHDESQLEATAQTATPVEALDGMASGRSYDLADIPTLDRPLFERTEWERKSAGVRMDRIGGPMSADGKIGFAILPRLADSTEAWELAASVTSEDVETQRLVDYGRQLVVTEARKRREARRKEAREKLLAEFK